MQNVSPVTVDSPYAGHVTLDKMVYAKYELGFGDAVLSTPSTPPSFPAVHASQHVTDNEGVNTAEPDEDAVPLGNQHSAARGTRRTGEVGVGDSPEVGTHA